MDAFNGANIITEPVDSAACPKCGKRLNVKELPAFSNVRCPGCGDEFPVPSRFGPFLLLRPLGAGGMGGVYRAKDEGLNREIAVKVMLKSLGEDPHFVETFQREAQAAAKLNHPHIVQIYSFGQEKGQPYIAMELVAGGSLDKMMARQGPLDPAVALKIGMQIAQALNEAAEAGLVHGDVKPENILFDADKNAKLADFGLAALAGGPAAGGEVWGTPYYIAPEKVRKQKFDYRADIYSLGGTLYHAIAGVPPFEGADAAAVVRARFDGPPRPLSEIRPGVKPEVAALIGRMLEMDPGTRYPTYGSLLGDMNRYLSSVKPVNLKREGRRIVIKGRSAPAVPAAGAAAAAGTPPDTAPKPRESAFASYNPAFAEPPQKMKKGCRTTAFALGGLALLAGIIIGIGYIAWDLSGNKDAKEQFVRVSGERTTLAPVFADYLAKSGDRAKKMKRLREDAMGYAKKAADRAVMLLGEGRRKELIPEEPEYTITNTAPPLSGPANAAAGATNAPAAGATNAPPGGVTNAPPGGITNAPPARVRRRRPPSKKSNLLLDDDGLDSDKESGVTEESLVRIVRAMYEDAYSVKGAHLYMQKTSGEIAALVDAFSGIRFPEKPGVDSLPALQEAENEMLKIKAELEAKIQLLNASRQVNQAPNRVARLKKRLERVRSDSSSLLAMKRQAELEAQKKERERLRAEEQKRKADAHKEKAGLEQGEVAAMETKIATRLKDLKFDRAEQMLKGLSGRLETDEGRYALETVLERVGRLKNFHDSLVKKLAAFCAAAESRSFKSSAKNWMLDNADERKVTVRSMRRTPSGKEFYPKSTARDVPWTEIYNKQGVVVNELIYGLMLNPAAVKGMTRREYSKVMTDTALFLTVFYKDLPSAQKMAGDLARKAGKEFEIDIPVIRRLLPELSEE